MKTFDTLSLKYLLPTFVPGIVLAFDLVMLCDLFPDYLNLHFLQPFFCFELFGAAFLFAMLALFALALVEWE